MLATDLLVELRVFHISMFVQYRKLSNDCHLIISVPLQSVSVFSFEKLHFLMIVLRFFCLFTSEIAYFKLRIRHISL